MKINLRIKKYQLKGDLANEYSPLINKREVENGKIILKEFDTNKIKLDVNHPVDLEIQPAYDNSVNIITNDDKDAPRLINSGWSYEENNTYRRILRNQTKQTNYYNEDTLESETRLQRITSTFCKFDLVDVTEGGSCAGGNYTFYLRYADEDENLTPFVAESSKVVVYNGSKSDISTIYGTVESASTDKSIVLKITNLDTAFNKFQLYYSREYSDFNGVQKSEFKKVSKLYTIKDSEIEFTFTGIENVEDTTRQELNIQYNIYDRVKTQAQVQNMLFFGNVDSVTPDFTKLQDLAYYIKVSCTSDDGIYKITGDYQAYKGLEYYDPKNIYKYTGYLPGEFYRLGVVFVLNNDQCTDVFNLLGCNFSKLNELNINLPYVGTSTIDQKEIFMTDSNTGEVSYRCNTKGVFRTPNIDIYQGDKVFPIAFNFEIPESVKNGLLDLGIKGLFFVRQKRIPILLTQGYGLAVSSNSHTPLLPYQKDNKQYYYTQGLFNSDRELEPTNIILEASKHQGTIAQGLICQEAFLNKNLQSLFNGSEFKLRRVGMYNCEIDNITPESDKESNNGIIKQRTVNYIPQDSTKSEQIDKYRLAYIPPECPSFIIDKYWFSTKAGSAEDFKSIRSLEWNESSASKPMYNQADKCSRVIRGNFGPFIGVLTDSGIVPNGIYNIYTTEYDGEDGIHEQIIKTRSQNNEPYTAITDRFSLDELNSITAYRGDCFTGLISCKMEYNFLDSNTPLNNKIISTGEQFQEGDTLDKIDFENSKVINLADWNAVQLGYVFTYRFMSSMNLSIRSINEQYTDERSLFGGYRSFYPHNKFTYSSNWKLPESDILNFGLSNNRNHIDFFEHPSVPYIKDQFDTRIAFSNIQVDNAFKNSYRIFQGLSYQDLERTYGALTKILPLGANLFGVFEHGLGIIPINEKALIQTTTGQNIHMYGTGVIQSQITVVSQDYGSTWEDSVINTPDGIYGVDTWAKKIWKYSARGFELISDQQVQSFLNENINLSEADKTPIMAYRNVKTHYNNFKGDVMFTFYNSDKTWNLCYNERLKRWTTRYSWTPLLSANRQNSFISIDQQAAEIYSGLARQINHTTPGLIMSDTGKYTKKCRFDWVYDNGWSTVTKETKYESEIKDVGDIDKETGEKCIVEVQSETQEPINYDKPQIIGFQLYGWDGLYNDVKGNIKSIQYPKYDKTTGEYVLVTLDARTAKLSSDGTTTNFRFLSSTGKTNQIIINCEAASLNVNLYLYDDFIPWIKVNTILQPRQLKLNVDDSSKSSNDTATVAVPDTAEARPEAPVVEYSGKPFSQTLYLVASWDAIKKIDTGWPEDKKKAYEDVQERFNDTLRLGLYTHGRAGNYDEINYSDEDMTNQILPTRWYNKQEPFELEFVVNTSVGLQKIFNNLVIISNNVQPDEIEYELVGDAYNFNKANIFAANNFVDLQYNDLQADWEQYYKDKLDKEYQNTDKSQDLEIDINNGKFATKLKTEVVRDEVLNQYMLKIVDKVKNIKDYGRLIGNIEYREDKWNVVISPIYFRKKEKIKDFGPVTGETESDLAENAKIEYDNCQRKGPIESAKLRDKWMKVRIRYKGDKLVVITAIQSLLKLSFS